jgi:hypothetical protein
MKDTNKRAHGNLVKTFNTHRGLCQSEEHECMST